MIYTGNIEFIEKLFDLTPCNIEDIAAKYLKAKRGLSDAEIQDKHLEFSGVDDEMGYMVDFDGEDGIEFLGLSDSFVSTFNDSDSSATATIDPIWVNILYKNLYKASGFQANQYMVSMYTLVDELEVGDGDIVISHEQAQDLKDRFLAIEARLFTPQKQKLTEAEKIMFMTENID